MIKFNANFVRSTDASKGGPNSCYFYSKKMLAEGKREEAEKAYNMAIENGYDPQKDQSYAVDPYYVAHFPEFDSIEECEKRAVRAMMEFMKSKNEHIRTEEEAIKEEGYLPVYRYWDKLNYDIGVIKAGIAELVKDYPELSAEKLIDHASLLLYVYFNDLL